MKYRISKAVFIKDVLLMFVFVGFITIIDTFIKYHSNYMIVGESGGNDVSGIKFEKLDNPSEIKAMIEEKINSKRDPK